MRPKNKIYILVFGLLILLVITNAYFVFAQTKSEEFIYNSEGKRDPFISLVDQSSPSGLRTMFTPPRLELEVKLPLEINLSGVLWNGREYFAIINGEVLKEDQQLGEIQVKEIKPDKVILQYRGREFVFYFRKGE